MSGNVSRGPTLRGCVPPLLAGPTRASPRLPAIAQGLCSVFGRRDSGQSSSPPLKPSGAAAPALQTLRCFSRAREGSWGTLTLSALSASPALATRPRRSRDTRVPLAAVREPRRGPWRHPRRPGGPPVLGAFQLKPFQLFPNTPESQFSTASAHLPLLRNLTEPLDWGQSLGDPRPQEQPRSDPGRSVASRSWPLDPSPKGPGRDSERQGEAEGGHVPGHRLRAQATTRPLGRSMARGAAAGSGVQRRRGAASQSGSLLGAAPAACTAPGAGLPDSSGSFRGSGRARAAGRGAGHRSGSGSGPPGQAARCLDAPPQRSFSANSTSASGENSREPLLGTPSPMWHRTASVRFCPGKVVSISISQ